MSNTTVYIEKEKCDHVRIKNGSGADLVQFQFAVIGPYAGVADEAIKDGAVGSFHVEEGIQLQSNTLHAAQNTFATIGNPVYWDAATETFSDTLTAGYYIVGHLLRAKDSNGVIVFEKVRYAKLVPADLTDIQEQVDAITEDSGIPFIKTATLASAAAATPVTVVEVPAGKKAVVTQVIATVNGNTAWGTTTKVSLQDTANTPVVGAEFAASDMASKATLTLADATVKAALAGFTVAKDLVIVGDANGTGSDLIVTVIGYIV